MVSYLYASREEILPLAGLEPQTLQPVASCYTEHDGIFEDICYNNHIRNNMVS